MCKFSDSTTIIVKMGTHPKGEPNKFFAQKETPRHAVDIFGGKVHIEWDPSGVVTPFGQSAFFVEIFEDRRIVRSLGR